MIYTIVGENDYLRDQEIRRIETETGLRAERYDGVDITENQLADLVAGSTLFGDKRLIVIRDLSDHKQLWAKFDEWIGRVSVDTTLTLVETRPDKRTRTYKLLQKQSTVIEVPELTDRQVGQAVQWLLSYASAKQLTLSRVLAESMVRRAMTPGAKPGSFVINQQLLATALEVFEPSTHITEEVIATVLPETATDTAFELLHAALTRDSERVTDLLKQLQSQADAHMVLALLASQWSQLVATALTNKPAAEIAQDLGAHPFVIQKVSADSRLLKIAEVSDLTTRLAQLDLASKTTQAPVWDSVAAWLMAIVLRP